MFRVEAKVDREAFRRRSEFYKSLPDRTRAFVNGELKRGVETRLLNQMRIQPRQSALPFVWSLDPAANARGRRWWFANYVAKQPKGRRKRYKRSGALAAGWKIVFDARSGTIRATHPDERGVRYTQAERQVPSHAKTKWRRIDILAPKEAERASEELRKFWRNLAREQKKR
jgi:hypothetical protein